MSPVSLQVRLHCSSPFAPYTGPQTYVSLATTQQTHPFNTELPSPFVCTYCVAVLPFVFWLQLVHTPRARSILT